MKAAYVVGIVVPAHLIALGILLFQPGCQTTQNANKPNPSITSVERQTPMSSPSAPDRSVASPSGAVHSDFNAGIGQPKATATQRFAPTRPVESYTPDSNVTSTDIAPGEVLVPVTSGDQSVEMPVGPDVFYKVHKGDTLSKIARTNNIPLSSLLEANNLDRRSTIYVGQELLIPSGAPQIVDAPAPSGNKVKVRKGDTLGKIARRNGVNVNELKSANGLRGDIIYVGQELYIPGNSSPIRVNSDPAPSSPKASGDKYTVRSGDTLGRIAKRYGVKTSALKAVNGLSSDTIYVGQKLYLPDGAKKVKTSSISSSSLRRSTQPAPASEAPVITPVSRSNEPTSMVIEDAQPVEQKKDPMAELERLMPSGGIDIPVVPVNEQQTPAPAEPVNP